MRFFAPMTLIVVLVLAACLIGGLVIVWISIRRSRSAGVDLTCPRCGMTVRPRARFCARCGAEIESPQARAS